MQNLRNKTYAIMIALILTISMAASIMLQPTVNAHSPSWTIVSYAYMTIAPTTCGVGQTLAIVMWTDTPLPGAVLGSPVKRANYILTITKPDGTVATQSWPVVDDPTGIIFYHYTPDQVGNYTMTFNYPQQTYIWNATNTPGLSAANANYYGDVFTAASATTTCFVQQTPIPEPINSYPMPTEYWTRPIEQENTYWYSISSNWLGYPYIIGAANANYGYLGIVGGIQPYGSAPTSAHIMWTKPIEFGGIVGGNDTNIPGEAYCVLRCGEGHKMLFADVVWLYSFRFFPYGFCLDLHQFYATALVLFGA